MSYIVSEGYEAFIAPSDLRRSPGGVPAPLDSDEVGRMLRWLPCLTAVFPETVALAIRMLKLTCLAISGPAEA